MNGTNDQFKIAKGKCDAVWEKWETCLVKRGDNFPCM